MVRTASKIKTILYQPAILIAMILFLGLVGRLYGINHGLPYIYDPDEPLFVDTGMGMIRDLDPNPHWFGHPGTTLIYLLVGIDLVVYAAGSVTGSFNSPSEFRTLYHQDPSAIYISSRLLIVIFAILTVYLVYRLATKLGGKTAGLLAALFLAVAPLHVTYSKFIRTDVPVAFLILLSFYGCLMILDRGEFWAYALAGFAAGLGIATKYPAAIIIPFIIVAHVMRNGFNPERSSYLFYSGIACLMGAFIGSPYLFLDLRAALSGFLNEATNSSAVNLGYGEKLIYYLRLLSSNSITWPGLLIVAMYGIYSFIYKQKESILLFSFTVVFLLCIAVIPVHYDRWVVPLVPVLCLLLALVILQTLQWMKRYSWVGGMTVPCLVISVLISVPSIHQDIQNDIELAAKDTRIVAGEWILANLPKGSHLLLESYTPILPKDQYVYYLIDESGNLIEYDPEQAGYPWIQASGYIGDLKDVSQLGRGHIDYMIMGRKYFYFLEREGTYASLVSRYQQLMSSGELIYEISPVEGKNGGSKVLIYKFSSQ